MTPPTVDLRKVDVDGTDYDVDPPAGVMLQILGSTSAFDAIDLGGGRLRLTATGQSGTTVRIATVPGQSAKPELTVTSAELQPGVVEIPDSQVLYPPPGVPGRVHAGHHEPDRILRHRPRTVHVGGVPRPDREPAGDRRSDVRARARRRPAVPGRAAAARRPPRAPS